MKHASPTRRHASCSALVFVGILLGVSPGLAQTISVDSVPTYGTLGFIGGSVTGVDTTTHHVAVYIQIEGSGWWTKPTTGSPTVAITLAGTFTANVGTGGAGSLDSRATIFCAALLPIATTPAIALGAERVPASLAPLAIDCRERYGRTLDFAGYTWAVKESHLGVGPGLNVFSDRVEDVFVDQDGLHLRVASHDGQWWATEVILLTHLGHGTYAVQTDSELDDLDANVTFGMFTWDSYGDDETVPGEANREIDFEDSRWTNAGDPTNAQMVVQPYTTSGNLRRYTLPDLSMNSSLTRIFTWLPSSIRFTAATGFHPPTGPPAMDVIDEFSYSHGPPSSYVPPAGREYFRLNLWPNNVQIIGGPPAPASAQPVEVVIKDVTFVPEPGTWMSFAAGATIVAAMKRRHALASRANS